MDCILRCVWRINVQDRIFPILSPSLWDHLKTKRGSYHATAQEEIPGYFAVGAQHILSATLIAIGHLHHNCGKWFAMEFFVKLDGSYLICFV